MEQLLLTISDAQRIMPIGRTKMYELINTGEVQRVKIGRKPFLTAKSVHAYIERLTSQEASGNLSVEQVL